MSDTLGGGLKISGTISRAERLALSDKCRHEHAEAAIKFLRTVLDNPMCSYAERCKAAEALDKIVARGDALASKMAEEERIDDGKVTERQDIEVNITFDDAG